MSLKPSKNAVMSAISNRLAARLTAETVRQLRARCPQVSRSHRTDIWMASGLTGCARDNTAEAELEIKITPTWMIEPPTVKVHAPFMRDHVDWHVIGSAICYVHPHEWYDSHLQALDFFRARDPSGAIVWSSSWMLDAIDNLVHKHFLGWQAGLTDWPEEWDQWKHGSEGIQQYEQEKRAIR